MLMPSPCDFFFSVIIFTVNAGQCMMTRLQEMSLSYHFMVEQQVGSSTFAFFGFNGNDILNLITFLNKAFFLLCETTAGTAGVWRISALNESGGWNDQTTVEDMDLAVRATLRGWKLLYLDDLKVIEDSSVLLSSLGYAVCL